MALIGRLFAVFFGFLAACLVASIVVLWAIFFPEMSDVSLVGSTPRVLIDW